MKNPTNPDNVPAYRLRMKTEHANELYVQIVEHLTRNKLYREPTYGTRQLAEDIGTNTRYISAAVATCTGENYNALVNRMRLRDACTMLRAARFSHLSAEEIGLLSGFASRQAFYVAFKRHSDCTPREYREKFTKK